MGETDKKRKSAAGSDLGKARKRVLDKMAVSDIAASVMITLASTAYKKMGLPAEGNADLKDMTQAKQAIDLLEAILGVMRDDFEPDSGEAFRQTLAELKMTYAKLF